METILSDNETNTTPLTHTMFRQIDEQSFDFRFIPGASF